MATLFQRRVDQEWRLLEGLAAENNGLHLVDRSHDGVDAQFTVSLTTTTGLVRDPDGNIQTVTQHDARFRFPAFFPSVPIEAFVERVFHPNVDPVNGFACLWTRASAGDTIVEAVRRLQRVLAWEALNDTPDHVMQPEALAWYRDPSRIMRLPLPFDPIRPPASPEAAHPIDAIPGHPRRRRLV
jgi:ubiquitin-protein ligase